MERRAIDLADSPKKDCRTVLEIIREQYPERKQLGLFKEEKRLNAIKGESAER